MKQERILTKSIWEKFPTWFTRKVGENQQLCPKCGGLQVTWIENNQTLAFCQYCTKGVVDICPYCGEIDKYNHHCKGKDEANKVKRKVEEATREVEHIAKSEKLKWDDPIALNMGMLYSDHCSYNEGYFSSDEEGWETFLDNWWDEPKENRPRYVWGTTFMTPSLDVGDMIERCMEDHHEDAYDYIPEGAISKLSEAVDDFCNSCQDVKTYYCDYKYAIEIPWELYDEKERIMESQKTD